MTKKERDQEKKRRKIGGRREIERKINFQFVIWMNPKDSIKVNKDQGILDEGKIFPLFFSSFLSSFLSFFSVNSEWGNGIRPRF